MSSGIEFRRGDRVLLDGESYAVVQSEHRRPRRCPSWPWDGGRSRIWFHTGERVAMVSNAEIMLRVARDASLNDPHWQRITDAANLRTVRRDNANGPRGSLAVICASKSDPEPQIGKLAEVRDLVRGVQVAWISERYWRLVESCYVGPLHWYAKTELDPIYAVDARGVCAVVMSVRQ